MGQRLVISESEKKHIMSLYKQVTSILESVPPGERELVINGKNPFKYEEYTDARRKYSVELKDGDRFYEIVNFADGFLFPFLLTIQKDEIKSKLNGKTIRDINNDEIFKIVSAWLIITIGEEYNVIIEFDKTIGYIGQDSVNQVKVTENGDMYYVTGYHSNSYHFTFFGNKKEKINGTYKMFSGLENLRVYATDLLNNSIKKIKEWEDYYNFETNNIVNIPDEYFDIYKIKRRQTDF